MNDFYNIQLKVAFNPMIDPKPLIESYNLLVFNMILLIFHEIMYVFLKKQILYDEIVNKNTRIMKIVKTI
jgi:hypothetical protein